MSSEVPIPEAAVEAAARRLAARDVNDRVMDAFDTECAGDEQEHYRAMARVGLEAAAPLVEAAAMTRLAAELRADLHRLPEYTHGSLAWRILNEIDTRAASVLRGEGQAQ